MRTKVLILSFLLCLVAYAQDKGYKIGLWGAYDQHPVVVSNKQTTEGFRYVMSSMFMPTVKNSSIDEKSRFGIRLGMSIYQYSDSTYFDVNVMAYTKTDNGINIMKDSPLLIKLSDGEIIRLYCIKDEEDNVGTVASVMFNITEYCIIASYRITPADILKFKKGITKIRLEINAEKYDVEYKKYKKDELGQFLLSAYSLVSQELNKQTDFEEGF
ncbi:hypothetical protein QVN91_03305 [Bacteroides caecigallinarum]|nr:hypothetical protein [Bacteroides caecigallinarum]